MDGRVELDALAVGQTQHLVVVQHCVHVLYPEGIHWTIAHDPLVVVGGVLDTLPDYGGHETILPLQSELVHLTIELTHGDRLEGEEGKEGERRGRKGRRGEGRGGEWKEGEERGRRGEERGRKGR